MSESHQQIAHKNPETAAHAAVMEARAAAWQQASDRRTREFVNLMRDRGVGTTALYASTRHIVMTGSLLQGHTQVSTYSFAPLGEGWLIPGASALDDCMALNWMVLDGPYAIPPVVRCTPVITDLPPLYDKSPSDPPRLPYATLRGANMAAASVQMPFAHDMQYDWLRQASRAYIQQ